VTQPALDCAQRAADECRDFIEGRAGEEPQFDHHAVLVRQCRHGGLHAPRLFGLLGGGNRRGLAGGPVGSFLLAACDGPPLPPRFQTPVPQNAVEPGRKPPAVVEPRRRPPGLDERLLGEVLGFVVVAAERLRAPPERLGMDRDEPTKLGRIALSGTADQVGLVGNAVSHGNRYSPTGSKRFTSCPDRDD
jgi:hypothetical protein